MLRLGQVSFFIILPEMLLLVYMILPEVPPTKEILERTRKILMIYQQLTWHSHHGCPCPEDIHPCGVPITEWSVQTNISQLASPDMFLLRSNR